MKVTLKLNQNQSLTGTDSEGLVTKFDASKDHGGDGFGSSPMVVMLESMAACSFIDVLSILKKKRKQIDDLQIVVDGIRAEEHPKVYVKVHLHYILTSPDAEMSDLERSMELSQTKYCGASAMFQKAGCLVTWDGEIVRP